MNGRLSNRGMTLAGALLSVALIGGVVLVLLGFFGKMFGFMSFTAVESELQYMRHRVYHQLDYSLSLDPYPTTMAAILATCTEDIHVLKPPYFNLKMKRAVDGSIESLYTDYEPSTGVGTFSGWHFRAACFLERRTPASGGVTNNQVRPCIIVHRAKLVDPTAPNTFRTNPADGKPIEWEPLTFVPICGEDFRCTDSKCGADARW